MLTSEQANRELLKFAKAESIYSAQLSVAKRFLPPSLAKLIVAAVNDRSHTTADALPLELEALPENKLTKVLDAICPGFGKDLAAWWNWSKNAPFQEGWTRRAFRSPDPQLSLHKRWNGLVWLLRHLTAYPESLTWQARWCAYVGSSAPISGLLACAIDSGHHRVRYELIESIKGTHPIGAPSREAYIALLSSSDVNAWTAVEQLLLSAERAEGLRQTILEACDLGQPTALSRILTLISEHNLTRFAATIRAIGTWLGEDLDIRSTEQNRRIAAMLGEFISTAPTVAELRDATAEATLPALWAVGVRNVSAAITAAGEILRHEDPVRRRGAARFLAETRTHEALKFLAPALQDPDLTVYAAAVSYWETWGSSGPGNLPLEVKTALHERVKTLGKEQTVQIGTIGQQTFKISSSLAADVLIRNVDSSELTPQLVAAASADGRRIAAHTFAEDPVRWRDRLFVFFSDASSSIRRVASAAIASLPEITHSEVLVIEDALRRKASDLRTNALTMLRKQSPAALQSSIDRLAAGTTDQRRAAAELRGLDQPDTAAPAGTAPAAAGLAGTPSTTIPAELDFTAADRTPAVRPTAPDSRMWDPYRPGVQLIWSSLGAWLSEHADTEVETSTGVMLLANVRWLYATPDGTLPLSELIAPWWERIEPQLHDGGVELALMVLLAGSSRPWAAQLAEEVLGTLEASTVTNTEHLRWELLRHLARYARRPSWADPVLSLLETVLARLPLDSLAAPTEVLAKRGRTLTVAEAATSEERDDRFVNFPSLLQSIPWLLDLASLTDDQLRRLWLAQRFIDEPEGSIDRWHGPHLLVTLGGGYIAPERKAIVPDQPIRVRADPDLLLESFRRGIATKADVLDSLVVTDEPWVRALIYRDRALSQATKKKAAAWSAVPRARELVNTVRNAALTMELSRGDLPVLLSGSARELGAAYGAHTLVATVTALGKRPFARGYSWDDSRESSLSRLVRIHRPTPADTAQTYSSLLEAAGISTTRIIETAVYAPQWASLTEGALGWPGFESAVWWVSAHTNDDSWSVDPSIRNAWAIEISQRTPLSASDLVSGAADVAWFRTMLSQLGTERFEQVLKAAKYASSAGGHKRAELFATALMGTLDEDALRARISTKRHQDSVRALGLLPLPDDADERRAVTLSRYELLRGFVASDKKSGSMRRSSESAAVQIGMENLARTAGYRDPQRLIWSMETAAVTDIADRALTATVDDLTVTLTLDQDGAPVIAVERAGKPLKSVPAKDRKNADIAALTSRATELRKQAKRMRASLEQSMVTGDIFTANELLELLIHPIIRPMLTDLILVDAEGITGFTSPDPDVVLGPDGEARPVRGGVRIAHPLDLLASNDWADYQHNLVHNRRRQPFKQAFRELYTQNQGERDTEGVASRRYAGHQVNPRHASGIFTSRGWVADFETGHSRTFHAEKVTAWVHIETGWGTAADVEDAVIDQITFHQAGNNQPLPIQDVPGRVFSEVMRDLDLVVSVAHASGVDPEASESTIEVRSRLVMETAMMLGLDNVETTGHHARIKGTLGTYSVHLGSGTTHRIPGNFLFIIPVQAQHRGRIFLPFAEDDPRTAEIVSKTVMLAQDSKIKDPTIIQQIVT